VLTTKIAETTSEHRNAIKNSEAELAVSRKKKVILAYLVAYLLSRELTAF
jgi:hypothetical protein